MQAFRQLVGTSVADPLQCTPAVRDNLVRGCTHVSVATRARVSMSVSVCINTHSRSLACLLEHARKPVSFE